MEAIDTLGTVGAIGHKTWCFLRLGDPRHSNAPAARPGQTGPALSLHTSRADLRARLLPNPYASALKNWLSWVNNTPATGYPIQYQ